MKPALLRSITCSLIIFSFALYLPAQEVQFLHSNYANDSSYYDIARIAKDKFWAGGENGLIHEINSQGEIRSVSFPESNLNILRILANDDYIYVGTDAGGLFKYKILDNQWEKALLPKSFDSKCFYDMLLLPTENKLLVAGGHQKIAKGQKTLPGGFIASIDLNFREEVEILYKNPVKFVWAIEYAGGKVYASSYSGLNSKIMSASLQDLTFKKHSMVSGLVHHLEEVSGSIYYSGTVSHKYSQHGILGKLGSPQQRFDGYGCIWSIKKVGAQWVGVDYSGDILLLSNALKLENRIKSTGVSLYELEIVNDHQALIAGHGRYLLSLDLSKKESKLSVQR